MIYNQTFDGQMAQIINNAYKIGPVPMDSTYQRCFEYKYDVNPQNILVNIRFCKCSW